MNEEEAEAPIPMRPLSTATAELDKMAEVSLVEGEGTEMSVRIVPSPTHFADDDDGRSQAADITAKIEAGHMLEPEEITQLKVSAATSKLEEGHMLDGDEVAQLKEAAAAELTARLSDGHLLQPDEIAVLRDGGSRRKPGSPSMKLQMSFDGGVHLDWRVEDPMEEEQAGEGAQAAAAGGASEKTAAPRRRSRDSADERATASAVTEEAIDAAIASSPEPARPAPPAIVPVPPNADVPKPKPGRPTGRKDRASTDSKASVASSGKASIASSTKGGKAAGSAAGSKKGDAGTDAEEEKAKEQQRAERERKAAERAEAAQKVEAERKAAQKAEAEAKARAKAKAEAEAQAKQAAKEAERKAAKAAKEAKAQAAQGEAYQDHFPMAPAGLLLSGTDHADATLMHPDDLEAMGELDGMGGYPGGYLGGGSSEMNVAYYNRRQYLLPLEPPNAGERKLLAAERARSGRPAEPLMTPLFESGHGYIGQERHAHLHGRLVSRAELEAAGPRSRLAHQHAEERRAAKEERRQAEAEAMAAYHSYEDELLMDARQKAAAQREREMRQLEARLAEAMAIKQQGRSRRGGGGSGVNSNATSQMQSQTEEALNAAAHEEEMRMRAEAEEEEAMFMMNAQESIYSVVQHLSPFSLNRNLPWQIYATRPKRFARPGPDQLMGAGGGSSYAGGAGQCLADPLAQAAAAAEQSSLYGLGDDAFDGGDSSVPHYHARAVLRSVYDKPSAAPRRRPGGGGGKLQQHGLLPPIDAWGSPRGGRPSPRAPPANGRALSPRVLQPVGSYY